MTTRGAIALLQGGRAALGAGLVVAPQLIGERWVGSSARSEAGQIALRSLGAREVVVGLAAARSARRGEARSVAAWCLGLAACDVVDGVVTARARGEVPKHGVPTMAIAFGAAAAGVVLAARV